MDLVMGHELGLDRSCLIKISFPSQNTRSRELAMTPKVRRADGERAVCWPAAAAVSRDLVPDGTDEMPDTPARASSALRVVHESGPGIDLAAADQAAGQFLAALRVELDSEGLRGTPGRMARAYAELFTPRPFNLTTFPND